MEILHHIVVYFDENSDSYCNLFNNLIKYIDYIDNYKEHILEIIERFNSDLEFRTIQDDTIDINVIEKKDWKIQNNIY